MPNSLTELNIYKFEVEKFLGVCLDESSQELCINNFLNIDIPCSYTIDYTKRNGAYTIFDIYAFTESSDIIYVKHQLEIKLNLKVVDYDDDCELAEVICFNRNAALQKLVNDDNVISTEDIEQTDDESLDIIETQDIKRKIFELDI